MAPLTWRGGERRAADAARRPRSHAQIKGQKMALPTAEGFQGVMGHEASGTVEAVGEGVSTLKARRGVRARSGAARELTRPRLQVGDRVALEAGVPC